MWFGDRTRQCDHWCWIMTGIAGSCVGSASGGSYSGGGFMYAGSGSATNDRRYATVQHPTSSGGIVDIMWSFDRISYSRHKGLSHTTAAPVSDHTVVVGFYWPMANSCPSSSNGVHQESVVRGGREAQEEGEGRCLARRGRRRGSDARSLLARPSRCGVRSSERRTCGACVVK